MCSTDPNSCSEVFNTTLRKARKQHKCIECLAPIPAGVVYEYVSGIQDGSPWDEKRHKECAELWDFMHQVVCGGEGNQVVGGLREEINDAGLEYGLEVYDEERDEYGNPMMDVLEFIHDEYMRMAGSAP